MWTMENLFATVSGLMAHAQSTQVYDENRDENCQLIRFQAKTMTIF